MNERRGSCPTTLVGLRILGSSRGTEMIEEQFSMNMIYTEHMSMHMIFGEPISISNIV